VNTARDPERLDRLGVFSSVKFNAIAEGEGVVLQIDVREIFPYLPTLSIEITEENGTAVGPGLKSVNLLGRAISMSASARFGGQTVVELRAETPLFLGSSMSYEGAFVYRDRFNEVYAFQEVSTDFEVGFGRRWGETGRFGVIFNFLSVKSDTDGKTLSPSNKDEIPALGAFINYDSRDLISNPHEGWQNQFLLSKSGILTGDSDFWTYTIDVRRYQPLAAKHTLALFSLASLRTGTVGEDIPVYLQFNIGGTNTIRGWTLGARAGKNQFINTLEYRYELMPPRSGSIFGFSGFLGLQLAAFGDLGTAWNDGNQFMPSFIGGYGFGLRAIIPFVNMVRLDLGWGEAGMGVQVAIGVLEKADMQRRRVR
jgi:outer membrane protein insertion porin family